MSAPLGGGTAQTLASGQAFPQSIAVDASGVYWSNSGAHASLVMLPAGGGTPTTLGTPANGVSPSYDIALDALAVYWTDYDGSVKKMAKP